MGSWKRSFGSYLKTEDLQGHPVRVVIESVTEEDLGQDGKKETKLVAAFYGKDKRLVLNKTKCEALELLSGTDDTDHWVGLQIILAPGLTKYQGRTVGCIDIKPGTVPARPQAAPRGAAPAPRQAPRAVAPQVELPPDGHELAPEEPVLLREAPDVPVGVDVDDIPF
jgi:hypothetical protein